jgi:hypothetical protein
MAKKKTSENGKPNPSGGRIRIPIEWYFPDDLAGVPASHALLQHDDDEYHISFFEIPPPIVLGNSKQRADQLKAIDKVRATCRARIVMSEQHFKAFAEAVAKQVSNTGKQSSDEGANDE